MSKEVCGQSGGFTLPGEAGYEKLTLELAEKWGADVIRDSDGTTLSGQLTGAGYGVYSTLCVIRGHNKWARKNLDKLQQCFLCTSPRVCDGTTLRVPIMEDFFESQFRANDAPDAFLLWQVYDRTSNAELPRGAWSYDRNTGEAVIQGVKWHKYTVSFLAWRVWEEISMYNHTTNGWDSERLMQLDPIYSECREYLKTWLRGWCAEHLKTTVVRFTSLFYNFAWIWGSDSRNRYLFTDWASYDFTVSPAALSLFALRYGYELTAEDFVNKGLYRCTHGVPDKRKLDWMEFVNDFVISFGKELVEIVHESGKKAYVFYDDSWVGIEPYNGRFAEFGFDGIIKCVFSGFEARMCADVPTETHELRLHPYLFPVGLGGAPTFKEGGNPEADALGYWVSVRRALLRRPVERLGLGGYLHLVEGFPGFVDCITGIVWEFRAIRDLHSHGQPYALKPKVAVLHAWGKLRSWTLSGHFHETCGHMLIHVLESLSGLPLDVCFLDMDDISHGVPEDVDALIIAGREGSAWSGGELWKNDAAVEAVTGWVYGGGTLIGIGEPSATDGYDTRLRLAHILGVDADDGRRGCHGSWSFRTTAPEGLIPENAQIGVNYGVRLLNRNTEVWCESDSTPTLTAHRFGRGTGLYIPDFRTGAANTRLLLNLILHAAKLPLEQSFITSNPETECAFFPECGKLAVVNNSGGIQETTISANSVDITLTLKPYEFQVIRPAARHNPPHRCEP